jgi:MFS family permease
VTNSFVPEPDLELGKVLPVTEDEVLRETRWQGPQSMSRRLWVLYPLAFIGVNAVWGGVVQVLLATQVAQLVGPDNAPATLGIVASIAAVSSVISQPVAGFLNDRTHSRFGRRNVWIAGASLVSVVALLVTALSPSVPFLAIVWAAAMWPLNALQGALGAVLPERVPLRHRGSMSGVLGSLGFAGAFLGVAIAGLAGSVFIGYAGIAAILLVTSLLFAFSTKDYFPPQKAAADGEAKRKAKMPSLRADRDYWWTFAGRFTIVFGFFSISAFQLYILQNYIKVGDQSIEAASTALVGLSAVSTLATIVFALIGGWISDKAGRLRIFVAGATLMFVPAGVIYLLVPTYTGALIANVIMGAAFGVYLAVDQALISRVLPNLDNAARDLGIMNIANAGPQIIAPVVGGILVTLSGGYQVLFWVAIVSVCLSAVFVRFIRSVR